MSPVRWVNAAVACLALAGLPLLNPAADFVIAGDGAGDPRNLEELKRKRKEAAHRRRCRGTSDICRDRQMPRQLHRANPCCR